MLYTVWWDVCQQLLMPHTLTITHTLTKTHLEILPSLLCRCVASKSSVFFLFVSPISFCLAYSLSLLLAFSHIYCHSHSSRLPLQLPLSHAEAVVLRRSAQSTLICNPRKMTQASIQSSINPVTVTVSAKVCRHLNLCCRILLSAFLRCEDDTQRRKFFWQLSKIYQSIEHS